jgi:hypothetical protein
MQNISIKICLVIVALFGGVAGASDLPDCPSDTNARWHNCFRTWTFSSGSKYVGEWKDDKRTGQGTFTFGPESEWAGDKYVGEWKDNKLNGQGIYTHADGTVEEGIWKNSKFQYAKTLTKPAPVVKTPTQEKKYAASNALSSCSITHFQSCSSCDELNEAIDITQPNAGEYYRGAYWNGLFMAYVRDCPNIGQLLLDNGASPVTGGSEGLLIYTVTKKWPHNDEVINSKWVNLLLKNGASMDMPLERSDIEYDPQRTTTQTLNSRRDEGLPMNIDYPHLLKKFTNIKEKKYAASNARGAIILGLKIGQSKPNNCRPKHVQFSRRFGTEQFKAYTCSVNIDGESIRLVLNGINSPAEIIEIKRRQLFRNLDAYEIKDKAIKHYDNGDTKTSKAFYYEEYTFEYKNIYPSKLTLKVGRCTDGDLGRWRHNCLSYIEYTARASHLGEIYDGLVAASKKKQKF